MGKIYCFPVSIHLILEKNDKILLMKRRNTGFCDGMYSLPAGKLEPSERVAEAVVREAKEELGIEIKEDDLDPVVVMHRKGNDSERIDFFFKAKKWNKNIQNCEPDKCEDLLWSTKNSIPTNTIPYIKYVINNYSHDMKLLYYDWNLNDWRGGEENG